MPKNGDMMNNKKLVSSLITMLFVTTALAGCVDNNEEEETLGSLVIAYEIQSDYENIDENPQQLADYFSEKLNYDVSLYSVDSEGAMIEATFAKLDVDALAFQIKMWMLTVSFSFCFLNSAI